MRIAKNKNNIIIKCQDIENGIVKSNEYYCIKCNNILYFVSESDRNCSYFRHKNNNNYCDYYKNNKNYKNSYENTMSEFHRNWQEIFPNENIEYKIVIDNIIHFADIFIRYHNTFNICDIFKINKKNVIIEIQYSPIDYNTLYEREKHYITSDNNLLWIFDIKDKFEIEKLILFNKTTLKLRLKGKHYFTEIFNFNKNPNILLDGGGLYLYQIINIPVYDKELLEVKQISRNIFLKEISYIVSKDIINISNISKNKIKVYDYENTIINIKNISNENKDKLRYIFYVLENIPFSTLKNMFHEYSENNNKENERWYCDNCEFDNNYWNVNCCFKCKFSKPFNMYDLIYILALLSKNNENILNLLTRFINKNIVSFTFKKKINFGKYKGELLINIPEDYLRWLLSNKNDNYCKCNHEICDNCKLYENISNILDYSNNKIQKLFLHLYEHEGGREFDYTFTDFVNIYNKNNNKNLLLQINNNKLDKDFKITTNKKINKYSFIDDE